MPTKKETTKLNTRLKSDLELEVLMGDIAAGDVQIEDPVNGEIVLRDTTPIERIKATELLYKKRGSNAPTKFANTNGAGADVPPPMNDRQVDRLINAMRAVHNGNAEP